MKNLAKIFTAIVALVAISCTTEATEDLGIQGENGKGHTTITLSLEESRTQLGAETDGIYPLFWSEGDQISVNGVASEPLSAAYAGKATATFKVSVVAEKLNVAYPAAADGEVLFAENQVHAANNTFGSGVTTMFASGNSGEALQLKHLTGILKIGIVGEATLSHAQISTIDRAPITGAFAIDAEGNTTAGASAKSVINYSFGEGVTLSSEPTYIHVAVPTGEYDELYVTLYDKANGVMYATVKANETNTLKAGKLRTFKSNISYAATDKVVVIKNEADLKAFAAVAATTTSDVVLANDITLTEAWTPIEGYAGTIFGHGYAIKGLTAPLFGTTSASFKGLHLEGVNIAETANPNVGALARAIVATDTVKPFITNCTANGTLTVNCTEFTHSDNAYHSYAIGGLVGRVQGVDIADCTNSVAIDVKQVVASANTSIIYPSIAGVVGYAEKASLNNLANSGAIKVALPKGAAAATNNYANTVVPYIAGVAGFLAGADGTVAELTNNALISINGWCGEGLSDANNASQEESYSKDNVNYTDIDPCLAGVVAYLETASARNLVNNGKVEYTSGASRFHYVGGVVAMCGEKVQMSNFDNKGNISLPTGVAIASLHCGGVIAHMREGASLVDSNNNAGIEVKCSTVAGSSHRFYRVGGIVALARGLILNCHNNKGVTCDATIQAANHWQDVAIGGVAAVAYTEPITDSSNNGTILAKISGIKGGKDDASKRVSLGGVAGIVSIPCNNVTNNGRLETWNNHHTLYMGGVVGDMNYSGDKHTENGGYHNNGVVVIRSTTTLNHKAVIGGCVGYAAGALKNVNNNNANGFSFKAITNINDHSYIGGCVGWSKGIVSNVTNAAHIAIPVGSALPKMVCLGGCVGKADASVLTATNSGNISIGTSTGEPVSLGTSCYGGIVGKSDMAAADGAIKNATNNGSLSLYLNCPGTSHIGGIMGQADSADITAFDTADNHGAITLKNSSTGAIYAAGITPYLYKGGNNLTNHATATINITTNSTGSTYVSGIGGYIKANCSELLNQGDITINGMAKGLTLIAGFSANAAAAISLTDVKNEGDITFNADVMYNADQDLRIGGLQADSNTAQTWTNCYNKGNITITKDVTVTAGTYSKYMFVGGLSAALRSVAQTYKNCYNSGNITIEEGSSIVKGPYTGGCFGYVNTSPSIDATDGIRNIGTIKVLNGATSKTNNYVGGIVGYNSKPVTYGQCFCDIVAPSVKGVGMITGVSYAAGLAANSKLGGRIATAMNGTEPDYYTVVKAEPEPELDASGEPLPITGKFRAFFKVIYGGTWADASDNNCDNCSYISELVIE